MCLSLLLIKFGRFRPGQANILALRGLLVDTKSDIETLVPMLLSGAPSSKATFSSCGKFPGEGLTRVKFENDMGTPALLSSTDGGVLL